MISARNEWDACFDIPARKPWREGDGLPDLEDSDRVSIRDFSVPYIVKSKTHPALDYCSCKGERESDKEREKNFPSLRKVD